MGRLRERAGLIISLGVVLAALGASLAGCSTSGAEAAVVEDSFVVTGAAGLVVDIDNGSIEVKSSTSEGNGIQVTSTVRNPDRVDYHAEKEGNTVKIVAEVDDSTDRPEGPDGGADVVVSVPAEIDLDLEVSNGAITVSGIIGAVSARTSNGRVSITDTTGDVEAEASNGRLEITHLQGRVKAETSNGPIDFSGTLAPDSENSLETSNGSVEVDLIDTPDIEVDAATSNGRVRSSLPFAIKGPGKENELVGTIGDGGRRLKIRASNGSISIN